jgi:glutamine synthetase type III
MHPDLSAALAAERQKDLLASANRHRLAAAVAPPATLRLRLGRGLVSIGARLSENTGPSRHPSVSLGREEERC